MHLHIYGFDPALPVIGISHPAVATRDVGLYQPFRNALSKHIRSASQILGLHTLMWLLMCRRVQETHICPVRPFPPPEPSGTALFIHSLHSSRTPGRPLISTVPAPTTGRTPSPRANGPRSSRPVVFPGATREPGTYGRPFQAFSAPPSILRLRAMFNLPPPLEIVRALRVVGP